MSVCLSLCLRVCPQARASLSPELDSDLRLWRRCDMLCTSGFIYDVMFAHNGQQCAKRGYTLTDSTGGSTDMTSRRILKLTYQGAVRSGGGVISTIASLSKGQSH